MSDFEFIVNAIEKGHIANLLSSNRRIDGRSKTDFREIKIETNVIEKANGSAIVHLGKTKVIAGVKAQLATPWSDYPDKGSLMVGFETSPLSAPEYRLGPPSIYEIELARVTDRIIRESEVVNLEDLCIIPGEKCWQIIIDVYALDDFGNLFDASAIAAFAALSTTRIPEVEVNDGEVTLLESTRPIILQEFPVSVTTYKIGEHLVVDAQLKEEQIAEARLTFGLTEAHIVSGQKGGEGAFKSDEVLNSLQNAIKIGSILREKIAKELPNLVIAE